MLFFLSVVLSVAAPAHTPQMASNGSSVALAFGAGNAIYFTSSQDNGATFAPPVKVTEVASIVLSRHRGPHVAFTRGGAIIVSAVVASKPSPADGDLFVWRSTDGGNRWSKAIPVSDTLNSANEALHSLAADDTGRVFAVWLDHRTPGTKLYGSLSTDGGITWSKNVLVYQSPDGTICQCCSPSAAFDATGQLLLMWRNVMAGSRDMYLTKSRDGVAFSAAEKLGTGTWPYNACPMDGGGIALQGNRVVTAWRRDRQIYLDVLGQPEVAAGEGVDVSVAAGDDGPTAVWSTAEGIVALRPGAKTPVKIAAEGKFPNVVTVRAGITLAAWEADGKIVIQRLP